MRRKNLRGFGRVGRDRGKGWIGGRGCRGQLGGRGFKEEWTLQTKLGRLIKSVNIN